MKLPTTGAVRLYTTIQQWPLKNPFRITGHTWEVLDVLLVCLEKDGQWGRGEAAGIFYKNDVPGSMVQQIERLRPRIEAGLDGASVQSLLPPGGARNALDCAWWDLQAKLLERPVWELAGLPKPKPVLTTLTCGADTPEKMSSVARSYSQARAIKLKLTGESVDPDRVRAVREVREDVWLAVDANQGFTRDSLERLMPALVDARVALIEQPFPAGQDALLDGLNSPIPIAADESVQRLLDIPSLAGRFNAINIKLDKCGGLTEGLSMARTANQLGLDPMVGNMIGTSLAMTPAWLIGQYCRVVDLDGPVFLKSDYPQAVQYRDGYISCPEALWGNPSRKAPL